MRFHTCTERLCYHQLWMRMSACLRRVHNALTAPLCSALLRLLPVGESEIAPLPFSATSAFPHGIAYPLPAVSESGKVKPPFARPDASPSLPVCPSVSISVCACLSPDLTFQPKTNVLSLSCMHVVCFFGVQKASSLIKMCLK